MVANPWPLHFHAAAVVRTDLALRRAPAIDGSHGDDVERSWRPPPSSRPRPRPRPGDRTDPRRRTASIASASGGIGNEVARAFGLSGSTRSLTAPGERHLPQLFNIDRDISTGNGKRISVGSATSAKAEVAYTPQPPQVPELGPDGRNPQAACRQSRRAHGLLSNLGEEPSASIPPARVWCARRTGRR